MNIYFSDFFNVSTNDISNYGALNISLIRDLPLFIDPFLIFGSKKIEYQTLHEGMIKYLIFLKEKSSSRTLDNGDVMAWYKFSEVKQNWLGYSEIGNSGSGLGGKFGSSMSANMSVVFDDLGKEVITQSSHIEKAALFEIGVGKDNISDFCTNLIKEYLLTYTQKFAQEYIDKSYCKLKVVEKVYFDYDLERWMPKEFLLPCCNDDFVILTPKDILTKDDNWINSKDLRGDFHQICNSIQNNEALRAEINNYFLKCLPTPKKNKQNTGKEINNAINTTIKKFPELIKWYIKLKEENKEGAKDISKQKVDEIETLFISNTEQLANLLKSSTDFYKFNPNSSYEEAYQRIIYLKQVIENNDGYKLFYYNGKPINNEKSLQLIYRLTWYATNFDVNSEVNNGRGPADYKISMGASDKTIVEFKLASNSKLKKNLQNQVDIYMEANNTRKCIKAILYFTEEERNKVNKILNELNLQNCSNVVLIDASPKISASNV